MSPRGVFVGGDDAGKPKPNMLGIFCFRHGPVDGISLELDVTYSNDSVH